jgi:hypothetical protein
MLGQVIVWKHTAYLKLISLNDAKEEKTWRPCESQISLSVSPAVANPDLKVMSCEYETA